MESHFFIFFFTLCRIVVQVDAHNIVPVWVASDKQEVGARTIRKKITDKLPLWLKDIPKFSLAAGAPTAPESLLKECEETRVCASHPPILFL